MKRSLLTLLFLAFASVLFANNSPRLYVNSFDQELFKFKRKYIEFYKANMLELGISKADVFREQALGQIRKSRSEMKNYPSFKGNNDLKSAFLLNLDSLDRALGKEYSKVLKLKMLRARSYSDLENYYDELNSLNDKIKRYEQNLIKAQMSFLKSNNLSQRLKYTSIERQSEFFSLDENITYVTIHFTLLNEEFNELFSNLEHASNPKAIRNASEKYTELKGLLLLEQSELRDQSLDIEITKIYSEYLEKSLKILNKDLSNIISQINSNNLNSVKYRNALNELGYVKEDYNRKSIRFKESRYSWLKNALEKIEINT